MKALLKSCSLLIALILVSQSVHAEILCQRKKEKKPQPQSVLNFKIVTTSKCPEGFTKVGNLLGAADVADLVNKQVGTINSSNVGIKGDKGDTGAMGPQGPSGFSGFKGKDGVDGKNGILAISSCYNLSASSSGSEYSEVSLSCNNPENEFVQSVSYDLTNSYAHVYSNLLTYQNGDSSYSYPVGTVVKSVLPLPLNNCNWNQYESFVEESQSSSNGSEESCDFQLTVNAVCCATDDSQLTVSGSNSSGAAK